MALTQAQLQQKLSDGGVAYEVFEHEAVMTVEAQVGSAAAALTGSTWRQDSTASGPCTLWLLATPRYLLQALARCITATPQAGVLTSQAGANADAIVKNLFLKVRQIARRRSSVCTFSCSPCSTCQSGCSSVCSRTTTCQP